MLLLASGSYLACFAYRGWIPHDAGTLALSAERVLSGELPHRDFDDMYTGGLSYLNALAFWILGVQLSSIRTVFFTFVLAFVLAAFWIAIRVSHKWIAALLVLACLGWSVPNYFAGLPSWYNLFFATFGLLSLLKYVDTLQRRWLFCAGFWGGVGIIFKIVALYYVAAAFFFLIYRMQYPQQRQANESSFVVRIVSLAIPCGVSIVWLQLLWMLLRERIDTMGVIQFFVPSVAVCATLIWGGWRVRHDASPEKLCGLLRDAATLAAGILLPITCFLVPFMVGGGIDDLFIGVIVTPQLRLDQVTHPLPKDFWMVLEIPVAVLLSIGFTRLGRYDRCLSFCLVPAFAMVLWCASVELVHELVFLSVRLIAPVIAVLSVWLLQCQATHLSDERKQEVFLTVTMASFLSLLQFPFSAPIYFCFVAPLAGLAAQYLVVSQPHVPHRLKLSIIAFCLLFAFGFLNQHSFFRDPRRARLDPAVNALSLPRAGIFVSSRDKRRYETLVRTVQECSPEGGFIYATPDCPEVYFLAERKNPARSMFELFESPERLSEQQLELLSRRDIAVVVINLTPKHSPPVTSEFISRVSREFPYARRIDNFLVAVRDVGNAMISTGTGEQGLGMASLRVK